MKNPLSVELMEYSSTNIPHLSGEESWSRAQNFRKTSINLFPETKKAILTILIASFWLYRVFYQQRRLECVSDLLHEWTSSMNRLLNQNDSFYQVMLIIAQQSIEINILLLCIISTLRLKSLKVSFFMVLYYGIRGILLNIERFPYPQHIIWDAPIIPSLTVPYGITRDYFYSGHTGLMLFCSYLWKDLGYKALYWPSLVLTPVVILVLLSTRVHYSIDIVAAFVFTFWIEGHLLKYVIVLDKFFSFAFGLLEKAFHCIRKTIA